MQGISRLQTSCPNELRYSQFFFQYVICVNGNLGITLQTDNLQGGRETERKKERDEEGGGFRDNLRLQTDGIGKGEGEGTGEGRGRQGEMRRH